MTISQAEIKNKVLSTFEETYHEVSEVMFSGDQDRITGYAIRTVQEMNKTEDPEIMLRMAILYMVSQMDNA